MMHGQRNIKLKEKLNDVGLAKKNNMLVNIPLVVHRWSIIDYKVIIMTFG